MTKPELLAPIQDMTSLQTAIEAGADAVYFGVRGFNMRAGARNFEVKDLAKIVRIAHKKKVKVYLALNIIIYEDEIKQAEKILTAAKKAGVDAIICWDMSIIRLAKKMGLKIHLSTQASVANSEAAEFYKSQGVSRIVLARECTLEQIKKIKQAVNGTLRSAQGKIQLEMEAFIHGAMCVSISGRCFMSQYLYGKSANRGECLQPCRRKYVISQVDDTPSSPTFRKVGDTPPKLGGDNSFELGEDYVLSPKDLCTLPFIEKLIEADVDCFKIEGRNRSAEYVKTVVEVYKKVIDFYQKNKKAIKQPSFAKATEGKKNKEIIKEFEDLKKWGMEELGKVYNRGFGNGFYLGKPMNEWTYSYGSQAREKKIHIGKVNHFYGKIKVAEILIQAKKIVKVGDILQIEGPKTGVLRQKIDSIEIEHKKVKRAGQKDLWAVKLNKQVKANDKVYKIVN